MRVLALDIGDKRTGVAVGDTGTRIVSPVAGLEAAGDALVEAVRRLIAEHAPDVIVIGLPLNMDGTEGDRAKIVRAVGERLAAAAADLPVHYQDERLTTFAADQAMARSGLTRGDKKKRRDALAAVEILRDYDASPSCAVATVVLFAHGRSRAPRAHGGHGRARGRAG